MNVQYLKEDNKNKFAILPYRDFLALVEMAAAESDYQKALKILNDKKDVVLNYDSSIVLENPIKKMREARGGTQAELAKKMKVDTSYVSRIEKAGAKISRSTLEKAAKAFGCSVDDID